ncbi:unnamed protein product [Arctia plantaginis]|uniref:Amyloid protein-binding protein 2 n=1 Tax=Arctia plantaginis TaxID=874455 RepID=A0A8S0Z9N8_ARCPL|nr:unnamed protein product [Arctia plantaginis]
MADASSPTVCAKKIPENLYELCLTNLVNYLHKSKCERNVLRGLPDSILMDVYYKMLQERRLCILDSELSELDVFERLMRFAGAQLRLLKCFQAVIEHGSKLSAELARNYLDMCDAAKRSKDSLIHLGLRLGGFLNEAGWYADAERVLLRCRDICQSQPQTTHNKRITLECCHRLLNTQSAYCCFPAAAETYSLALKLLDIPDDVTAEMPEGPFAIADTCTKALTAEDDDDNSDRVQCESCGGSWGVGAWAMSGLAARVCKEFSALFFVRCDYNAAFAWSMRALKLLTPHTPPKITVEVLRACGKACVVKRRFGAAGELVRHAVALARRAFGPRHPRLAAALLDLGFYLLNVDSIVHSVAVYTVRARLSLSLSLSLSPPRHPRLAAALLDLGFYLLNVDSIVHSVAVYTVRARLSLSLSLSLSPPRHPRLAAALLDLGFYLLNVDSIVHSVAVYTVRARLSLSLSLSLSPPRHPRLAAALLDLGFYLLNVDSIVHSVAVYTVRARLSLSLSLSLSPPRHPRLAAALLDLGFYLLNVDSIVHSVAVYTVRARLSLSLSLALTPAPPAPRRRAARPGLLPAQRRLHRAQRRRLHGTGQALSLSLSLSLSPPRHPRLAAALLDLGFYLLNVDSIVHSVAVYTVRARLSLSLSLALTPAPPAPRRRAARPGLLPAQRRLHRAQRRRLHGTGQALSLSLSRSHPRATRASSPRCSTWASTCSTSTPSCTASPSTRYGPGSLSLSLSLSPPRHPRLAAALLDLGFYLLNVDSIVHSVAVYTVRARLSLSLSLALTPRHPRLAAALLDLGFYLLNVDSIVHSVAVYTEALKILTQVFGSSNLHVATAQEDLAYALYVLEYSSGRFYMAKDHAERAIRIIENLVPPDHLLLASAKRVKALILEEIALDTPAGQDMNTPSLLEESEALHKAALALSMMAFGEKNVQTAKHYGNLGRLYQSMQKFQDAETMHLKAIAIKEELLGPEDYEVGLSIGHLASLYNYHMNMHCAAEKLYLRSISISLKLFGERYSGLEYDYRGLVHVFTQLKRTDRANHYNRLLQHWQELREQSKAEQQPALGDEQIIPLAELHAKFFGPND